MSSILFNYAEEILLAIGEVRESKDLSWDDSVRVVELAVLSHMAERLSDVCGSLEGNEIGSIYEYGINLKSLNVTDDTSR